MVEADCTCSNRRRVLIGSWVTPPTTGIIKIERGGDENITINHGCGGGDCGGGSNSGGGDGGDGGNGGDGGGRESNGGVGCGRADETMETMKTMTAVKAEAKATTSQQ